MAEKDINSILFDDEGGEGQYEYSRTKGRYKGPAGSSVPESNTPEGGSASGSDVDEPEPKKTFEDLRNEKISQSPSEPSQSQDVSETDTTTNRDTKGGKEEDDSVVDVLFDERQGKGVLQKPGVGPSQTLARSDRMRVRNADDVTDYMDQGNIPYKTSQIRELRAQNQSAGEKWAHGIPKLLGKTGTAFIGGTVGVVYGLGSAIGNSISEGDWSEMQHFWDNDFQSMLMEADKTMDEALPHYYTEEERENNFFESMGTANFWSNDMTQGISFMAGAVLSELATAGLATAALPARAVNKMKGLSRLSRMSKAAGKVRKASNISRGLRGAAFTRKALQGSAYEASVEAHHHRDMLEERMLERFEVNNGRKPTESEAADIRSKANSSANKVFGVNMALVSSSNATVLPSVFGMGWRSSKSRIGKMISRSDDTFVAQGAKKGAGRRTLDVLQRGAYEGIVEEGGQSVAHETFMDYNMREFDPEGSDASHSLIDSFKTSLENTFGEGIDKEVGIGFILGLAGGTYQGRQDVKQDQQDAAEASARADELNRVVEMADGPPREVAEELEKDPGLLGAMRQWYKNAKEHAATNREKDKALFDNDAFAFKNMEDDQIYSYFKAHHDANRTDTVVQDLEDLKSQDASVTNRALGIEGTQEEFSEKGKNEIYDEAIRRAKRVSELSDQVEEIAPEYTEEAKNALVHDLFALDRIDQRIDDLSKEVYDDTKGAVDWKSIEKRNKRYDTSKDPEELKKEYQDQIGGWLQRTKARSLQSKINQSPELKERLKEIDKLYNKEQGKTSMFQPGEDITQHLKNIGQEVKRTIDPDNPSVTDQERLSQIGKAMEAVNGLIENDVDSPTIDRTMPKITDLTKLTERRAKFMDAYNKMLSTEGRENLRKQREEAKRKQEDAEEQRTNMEENTEDGEATSLDDLTEGDVIEYADGAGSSIFEYKGKDSNGKYILQRGPIKKKVSDKGTFDQMISDGRIKKRPNKNDKRVLETINDDGATVNSITRAIDDIGKDNLSTSVKREANSRIKELKAQQERNDTAAELESIKRQLSDKDKGYIESLHQEGVNDEQVLDEARRLLEGAERTLDDDKGYTTEGTEDSSHNVHSGPQDDTGPDSDINEYDDGSPGYENAPDPDTEEDPSGLFDEDEGQPYSSSEEPMQASKGYYRKYNFEGLNYPPMFQEDSQGDLKLVVNEDQVVYEDDTTRPLGLEPYLKNDPEFLKEGDRVELELREDTEYWQKRKDQLSPDEHWKEAPIYIKKNGRYLDKLEAYKDRKIQGQQKKGPDIRKDIHRALKDGKNVSLEVKQKQTGGSNVINRFDPTGLPVLKPLTDLFEGGVYTVQEDGSTVRTNSLEDAVIGVPITQFNNGKAERVFFFGDGLEKLNVDKSKLRSEVSEAPRESFTEGTAHIIALDPKGTFRPLNLSTATLDANTRRNYVIEGLKEAYVGRKEPDVDKVEEIKSVVAHNNSFAGLLEISKEGEPLTLEGEFSTELGRNGINRFLNFSKNGSMIYMSPTKGQLIEVTSKALPYALEGNQNFTYRTIDSIETNDDGSISFNKSEDLEAGMDLREDLDTFLSEKRYNIDLTRINDRENPYTSPVTGVQYDNYLRYLSASREHVQSEQDSEYSTPAILRSNIHSNNGSVFYDTGVVMSTPTYGDTKGSDIRGTTDGHDPQPITPEGRKDENENEQHEPEFKRKIREAKERRGQKSRLKKDSDVKDGRIDKEAVRQWWEKRLGKEVGLNFYEALDRHQKIGSKVQHGFFQDNAAYIWNNAEVGTEYHEAFHAVFNMFLSEQEKSNILKEQAREEGKQVEGNELDLEESLAEKFRDYVLSQEELSFTGRIKEFFKSLLDYIKYVFNYPMTVDRLYRMVEFNTVPQNLRRRAREANTRDINRNSLKPDHNPEQERETIDTIVTLVQRTKDDLLSKGYRESDLTFSYDQEEIPGLLPEARRYLFSRAISKDDQRISESEAQELMKAFNEGEGSEGIESLLEKIEEQGLEMKVPDDYLNDELKQDLSNTEYEEIKEDISEFLLGITHKSEWYDQLSGDKANNVTKRGWETLVRRRVEDFGYRVREDFDIEETTEDIQKIYNRSHFEEDPKKKLSARIRQFLSTISSGQYNHLGFETFVDFDRIYNKLAYELSDIETLDGMKERIGELGRHHPEFGAVLDRLNQQEASFQADFFSAMRSTRNLMLVQEQRSQYRKGGRLEQRTSSYEINRNNLDKRFREQWYYNAIQHEGSPNPRHLYHIDNDGNISLNKARASNIIDNFEVLTSDLADVLSKTDSEQRANYRMLHKATRVLEDFGIEITRGELEAYLDDRVRRAREKGRTSNSARELADLVYKNPENQGRTISRMVDSIAEFETKRMRIKGDIKVQERPHNIHDRENRGPIDRFARIKRDFTDDVIGSFVDAMNKMIYPINLPTQWSDQIKRLQENTIFFKKDEEGNRVRNEVYSEDPRYTLNLRTDKYDSLLYRDASKKDGPIRSVIQSWDLNARKNSKEYVARIDYESAEEAQSYAIRLDAFINNGNKKEALMTLQTQADRTRMTQVRFPRLKQLIDEFGFSDRRDLLKSYVYKDLLKVQQTRSDLNGGLSEDQWSEGLHYEAKRDEEGNIYKDTSEARGLQFTALPNMEDSQIPTSTGYKRKYIKLTELDLKDLIDNNADVVYSLDGELTVDREEAERAIEKQIDNFEDWKEGKIEEGLNRLTSTGVIGTNKKGEIIDKDSRSIEDSKSSDSLSQLFSQLDNENLQKLYGSSRSVRAALRDMMDEFIVTDLVFRSEMTKLMRTGVEYSPSYEKQSKYWGGTTTPGTKAMVSGDLARYGMPNEGMPRTFNEATVRDIMTSEKSDAEITSLTKTLRDQGQNDMAGLIEKAYERKESNKTDAQAWSTIDFYRNLARSGHGQWTDSHEEAYQNYKQGGEFVDEDGARPRIKPLKPYYESHHKNGPWATMDVMKNSVLPLIRDFTKNYKVFDDLRRRMEASEKESEAQTDYSGFEPIDLVNTESAKKQTIIGAHDIRFEEGEFRDLKVRQMNSRDLRFPQEVPDKKGEDPIFGVQPMKNILTGIQRQARYYLNVGRDNELPLKGEQVFDLYNKQVADLVDKSMQKIRKELGYDEYVRARSEGTVEELQEAKLSYLKNLKEFIISQSEQRELPDNYEKVMEIVPTNTKEGYDFAVPLSFPAYQREFENILFSKFKKEALTQRINGSSAVQVAELGGHIRGEQGARGEELKFITTEGYRVQDANIEQIDHAEVAVSEGLAKQLGVQPGDKDSIENIPEDIRTMIGYRIPHSGMNLFLPMKIVDVFPDSYESAIMVPGEITTQQGSDFDVDKLILMAPNFKIEGLEDYVQDSLRVSTQLEHKDRQLDENDKEFIKGRAKDPHNFREYFHMSKKQRLISDFVSDFFENRITKDKFKKIDFDYRSTVRKDGSISKEAINKQSRAAVENGIMDVMESVLRSPNNLDKLARPIDDPEFGDLIEKHDLKEELDPHDPFTEVDLEMRNKAGASAIGVYANAQSGQSIAAQGDMRSTVPVVMKDNKDEELNPEKHVIYGLSSLRDRHGEEGDYIYYHFNKHLNAAVDNAKDQHMAFLNDNSVTQPATVFMLTAGIPSREASLLRIQPSVVKATEEFIKRNSTMDQVVGDLIKQADPEGKLRDTMVEQQVDGVYEMSPDQIEEDYENRNKQDEEWRKRQIQYLSNFLKFYKQGQELMRVNRTLTPDTTKNISSYAAIEEIVGRKEHTLGQDRIEGVEETLDSVPMMARFDAVLDEVTEFGDKQFIYRKPAFHRLKKKLETHLGQDYLREDVHNKVNNLALTYIFSHFDSPIAERMTREEAHRILIGDNNISTRLQSMKQRYEKIANNDFVQHLRPSWRIGDEVKTIRFDTTYDQSKAQKDMFTGSFYDLYQFSRNYTVEKDKHPEKLTREQQQEEIDRFVQDLVTYSVLVNGFAPSMDSFTDMIPVEIWSDITNDRGENMQQFYRRIEGEMNDATALHDIMPDIIKHMSEVENFIPKVPYQKVKSSIGQDEMSFSTKDLDIKKDGDFYSYIRVNNVKEDRHDIYTFVDSSETTGRAHYMRLQPKGKPGKLIEMGLTNGNSMMSTSILEENNYGIADPDAGIQEDGVQGSIEEEVVEEQRTAPEPQGSTETRRNINAFILSLNPTAEQIEESAFDAFERAVGMSVDEYMEQNNVSYRSIAGRIFKEYC